MKWAYDRAEVIADGIVHALGVALGVAGVLTLLIQVAPRAQAQITAALIYGAGLLTVLCLSATYNLWPISRTKWGLRRFRSRCHPGFNRSSQHLERGGCDDRSEAAFNGPHSVYQSQVHGRRARRGCRQAAWWERCEPRGSRTVL